MATTTESKTSLKQIACAARAKATAARTKAKLAQDQANASATKLIDRYQQDEKIHFRSDPTFSMYHMAFRDGCTGILLPELIAIIEAYAQPSLTWQPSHFRGFGKRFLTLDSRRHKVNLSPDGLDGIFTNIGHCQWIESTKTVSELKRQRFSIRFDTTPLRTADNACMSEDHYSRSQSFEIPVLWIIESDDSCTPLPMMKGVEYLQFTIHSDRIMEWMNGVMVTEILVKCDQSRLAICIWPSNSLVRLTTVEE
jgi:hypothetical protein